jgi:hypothetical protein
MKKILKYKGSRNWLITSLSVIIFFVVVTILAETVFFELITALVGNRPTKNFGAVFIMNQHMKTRKMPLLRQMN